MANILDKKNQQISNTIFERKEKFYVWLQKLIVERYLNTVSEDFYGLRKGNFITYSGDWIGNKVAVNGFYEKELLEDLLHFLERLEPEYRSYDVIDVGANIGNHSRYFAQHFRRVFAFEADPQNFQLLKFNTSFLKNTNVYNYAVSDKNASLSFQRHDQNPGLSRVVDEKADNKITIKCVPLDQIIDFSNRVLMLKIDVEGHEMHVLVGGDKLIDEHRPIICLEQTEVDFKIEDGETESIEFLRDRGYVFFEYVYKERRKLGRKILKLIKALIFGVSKKSGFVEAAFIPKGNYSLLVAVPIEKI